MSIKLKRLFTFLVRENQSNILLWLKAKLMRKKKVSVTLGSTPLSWPIGLLISWLGSSFVPKYWVFWYGLELILNARHKWPFGQDICNIIWKRGNLSYFLARTEPRFKWCHSGPVTMVIHYPDWLHANSPSLCLDYGSREKTPSSALPCVTFHD